MFQPRFRAVAMTDKRVVGEVVGERDGEVGEEARDVVLYLCNRMSRLCPGPALGPPPIGGVSRQARQLASGRKARA